MSSDPSRPQEGLGPTGRNRSPLALREEIRRRGLALGFDRIGFARAVEPPQSRERLLRWLAEGHHASMSWMARDPASRCDPEAILPGARSVVAVALQYYHPEPVPLRPGLPRISRYAWGEDYHEVVGERLRHLGEWIRGLAPEVRMRIACDTSPVMDKAWGQEAGLGWIGKNTCLLHPELGSWFFLGEIFLDLELPPEEPLTDLCGRCRRCQDVCPTGALDREYVLDASRCISYWTIEHRGPVEEPWSRAVGQWLVGCDLCQDVCPWNRRAPVSSEPRFRPLPEIADRPAEEWALESDDSYRALVRRSAIRRIKPWDMRRNANQVVTNRGRAGDAIAGSTETAGPPTGPIDREEATAPTDPNSDTSPPRADWPKP